jgi:hypothetical protein
VARRGCYPVLVPPSSSRWLFSIHPHMNDVLCTRAVYAQLLALPGQEILAGGGTFPSSGSTFPASFPWSLLPLLGDLVTLSRGSAHTNSEPVCSDRVLSALCLCLTSWGIRNKSVPDMSLQTTERVEWQVQRK